MNKQRKVLITITYNEMGIIIDTKSEEVAQQNLQPTCNQLATDCISRQAAIDGADEIIKRDTSGNNAVVEAMKAWKAYIGNLPSAEKPFKMPEIYVAEGFDTVADEDGNIGFGVYVPAENKIYVAGDVEDEIRARALLHEVCHWVQDMCGRPFDEDEANEFSDIVYDALPSAQPEPLTDEVLNEAHNEGYDVGYWAGRRDYERKWIPCSVRLPDMTTYVLVTVGVNNFGEEMHVEVRTALWNTVHKRFYVHERKAAIIGEVQAWMPLPEPYKERREE